MKFLTPLLISLALIPAAFGFEEGKMTVRGGMDAGPEPAYAPRELGSKSSKSGSGSEPTHEPTHEPSPSSSKSSKSASSPSSPSSSSSKSSKSSKSSSSGDDDYYSDW